MSVSPLIDELILALRCLPGVGPKSGQRMAYHLLERDRDGANRLAVALQEAAAQVGHCQRCHTLTEQTECGICASLSRDVSQLCIVESPADVLALESAHVYRGLYYVLMGNLSPLDGIGPQELGLERLAERMEEGEIVEVILATNSTVEGETTAHYVGEMARKRNLRVTRIAHGVPLGGELEYIDGITLSHAFEGRREV
jgi:recombination protein RecR